MDMRGSLHWAYDAVAECQVWGTLLVRIAMLSMQVCLVQTFREDSRVSLIWKTVTINFVQTIMPVISEDTDTARKEFKYA